MPLWRCWLGNFQIPVAKLILFHLFYFYVSREVQRNATPSRQQLKDNLTTGFAPFLKLMSWFVSRLCRSYQQSQSDCLDRRRIEFFLLFMDSLRLYRCTLTACHGRTLAIKYCSGVQPTERQVSDMWCNDICICDATILSAKKKLEHFYFSNSGRWKVFMWTKQHKEKIAKKHTGICYLSSLLLTTIAEKSQQSWRVGNDGTHTGWENSGASSLMFAILTRTVVVPECGSFPPSVAITTNS